MLYDYHVDIYHDHQKIGEAVGTVQAERRSYACQAAWDAINEQTIQLKHKMGLPPDTETGTGDLYCEQSKGRTQ